MINYKNYLYAQEWLLCTVSCILAVGHSPWFDIPTVRACCSHWYAL